MHLTKAHNVPEIVLPREQPLAYSASQHYHHSTHIASPRIDLLSDEGLTRAKDFFAGQGIDATHLSKAQAQLFERSSEEECLQLRDAWRISPPEAALIRDGRYDRELTVQEELEMARLRLHRKVNGGGAEPGVVDVLHSPGRMDVEQRRNEGTPEPYMRSGYEILAERDYNRQGPPPPLAKDTYNPFGNAVGYRPHSDPAFSSRDWWSQYTGHEMSPKHGTFGQPEPPMQDDYQMG